ncbi:lipopolysaccharide assembly LapA domain-containing protein [Micromonospora sp. NPDC051925]|uniref:lipopolysaccharide assembly LapA domain-containing protein n=1 Tax=Micromonospora sp. NPDC051925 TaxID=3364288 RepID=UPI0037CC7A02
MSDDVNRTRNAPADPAPAVPPQEPAVFPSTQRVPFTRTGAAWFGICAGALLFVVLIVFMLQNTRSVQVTFFWMQGTLPLALALLIAGVGSAILTMVVGVARITQLRRVSRRQHH